MVGVDGCYIPFPCRCSRALLISLCWRSSVECTVVCIKVFLLEVKCRGLIIICVSRALVILLWDGVRMCQFGS
jgi:hypothetical protein